MKDDTETITDRKGEQEEDRQDRRQFLNSLGKWSWAVMAAVAALRDRVSGAAASGVVTGTSGSDAESFRQRGPFPQKLAAHGDWTDSRGYIDTKWPYDDTHSDHKFVPRDKRQLEPLPQKPPIKRR